LARLGRDLILGEGQTYSGYSELPDGNDDSASAAYTVALGDSNTASGAYAT